MSSNQSIVWIDDEQACILSVEKAVHRVTTILACVPQRAPSPSILAQATPQQANEFFYRVARSLDWADEIVIVGPSATKVEFLRYMHKNDHAIDPRILGVENITDPTDAELTGFARLYFTSGGPYRAGSRSVPR